MQIDSRTLLFKRERPNGGDWFFRMEEPWTHLYYLLSLREKIMQIDSRTLL